MTRPAWRVLKAAILVLFLARCGYRLVGQNTFLPERIHAVAIIPFQNRTTRPEIEQRVTEETSREFSKRRQYRVVTSRDAADAVLEGAITGFRTGPIQFNSQGRATRVETIVTLDATLRDTSSDQVLWSQAGLLFRAEYPVSDTSTQVNPGGTSEYFDKETVALDEIARGAAGLLVSSILEGF